MKQDQILSAFSVPFTFSRQPIAIPGDLRPIWRLTFLALILKITSRGNKSSLTRLHVLNWAFKTKGSRESLLRLLANSNSEERLIVRYEPSLNRAIDLALGEGLLARAMANRLSLTAKGLGLASAAEAEPNCMVVEKEFLTAVGNRLTEQKVKTLTDFRQTP